VALEQANVLIEQAVTLGEAPEDPLALFSGLHALWVTNLYASKGDVHRDLAERARALAEKQKALAPLLAAHEMMVRSLALSGALAQSRKHCDQALALYDPVEHPGQIKREDLPSYKCPAPVYWAAPPTYDITADHPCANWYRTRRGN
jgi:hypothetical protein